MAKSIGLTAVLPLITDLTISGKTALKFTEWSPVCVSVMKGNNLLMQEDPVGQLSQ